MAVGFQRVQLLYEAFQSLRPYRYPKPSGPPEMYVEKLIAFLRVSSRVIFPDLSIKEQNKRTTTLIHLLRKEVKMAFGSQRVQLLCEVFQCLRLYTFPKPSGSPEMYIEEITSILHSSSEIIFPELSIDEGNDRTTTFITLLTKEV